MLCTLTQFNDIGSYLMLFYFSLITYGYSFNINNSTSVVNKSCVKICSLFPCGCAIAYDTFSGASQAAAKRIKRYIWDIHH